VASSANRPPMAEDRFTMPIRSGSIPTAVRIS
jgi:hypothetical protein